LARIDAVMKHFGFPMGPFAMSDLYVPVELDHEPGPPRGILDVTITGEDGDRLTASPVSRNAVPGAVSEPAPSDRLTL